MALEVEYFRLPHIILFFHLLIISADGCGGGRRASVAKPSESKPPSIEGIVETASILPPGAAAVVWIDFMKLRKMSLWQQLEGQLEGKDRVGIGTFKDFWNEVEKVAGGFYPAASGLKLFVIVKSKIESDRAFEIVKNWSAQKGVKPAPVSIRGRRAILVSGNVFVQISQGLYAGGSEPLANYCLGLIDKKRTVSARVEAMEYLYRHGKIAGEALAFYSVVPPQLNGFLNEKRLPSLIGGRLFFASKFEDKTAIFKLALLPGENIRPIWFANEINTFLVRTQKDKGVRKAGVDRLLDTLNVELFSRGVVVEGKIPEQKLVQVLRDFLKGSILFK